MSLRFLMVISAYPPHKNAGMEQGCKRLSEALARRGHQVIVLTQAGNVAPSINEETPNLKVYRVVQPIALGPLWGITYMTQLRRWGARLANEWDFCLCHKLYLHSAAFQSLCRNHGKIYSNLLVNAGMFSDIQFLREHKGGNLLLRRALDADAHFALSQQSRRELISEGVKPGLIFPYRYFVDLDRFSPGEEADPVSGEFLFLGRFHEQKNLPLLIEAFSTLWEHHKDARLRLVGTGPEDNYIRTLARESPAAEAITVEGWTDNPIAAYRRAWAVVSSSNAEGLSNVMVETLACGTPTITTDVSGARDALDGDNNAPEKLEAGTTFEGTGGMIVPMGDKAGLIRAMELLLTNHDRRQQMARDARRLAVERFSEERCVEEFLSGAEGIMAARKPRR